MRTPARLAIALCMIALVKGDQAEGCDPECDQPTDWMKFTSIDMKVLAERPAWSANWHAEFDHSNFDLRIHIDGEMEKK